MPVPKKIVITGTHHTPAIEFIRQLQSDPDYRWSIFFIGDLTKTDTHLKNTLIPRLKIKFFQLHGGKFDRRWLPNTLLGIPQTIAAFFRSLSLLSQIKPDYIVSFGGYISVPVILAGFFKKIPAITHEQTATLSLATKINSFFVKRVALSFPTATLFPQKFVTTGNLLRREIFMTRSPKFDSLKLDIKNYPLIYFTGGNQGATMINQLVRENLNYLQLHFTIIHQTGNADLAEFKSLGLDNHRYLPLPYVGPDDIGWVLNHAQVIISRAGANICQEIVALHQKAILIPLPHTQQDEQYLNAKWAQTQLPGSIGLINQDQLTPSTFLATLDQLLSSPDTRIPPPSAPSNLKLLKLLKSI